MSETGRHHGIGPAGRWGPQDDDTRAAEDLRQRARRTRRHLGVAVIVGLAAGAPLAVLDTLAFGVLVGWDVAAIIYMALLWKRLWPLDGPALAQGARYTDPARLTADLILLTAAVASLVAVGFALARAGQSHGWLELNHIGIGVISVVVSWAMVHTVFSLRYAHLYYRDPPGGITFPSSGVQGSEGGGEGADDASLPRFSDFAYLAFTIGMTFQVSDTALTSSLIRRTVLRHALLSFLFVTGILATTINLVAGLTAK